MTIASFIMDVRILLATVRAENIMEPWFMRRLHTDLGWTHQTLQFPIQGYMLHQD